VKAAEAKQTFVNTHPDAIVDILIVDVSVSKPIFLPLEELNEGKKFILS